MAKKNGFEPKNKAQADALNRALTAANGFGAEGDFEKKVEADMKALKKRTAKKKK